MKNNHLTYFKIENFKKFDFLEVNDIGQFNLIVGDNNVGKTCLLEALLLEFHAKKTLSALHFTFDKRKVYINNNVNYSINNENFNQENNLIGLCQIDKVKPLKIYRKVKDKETEFFIIENKLDFNPLTDHQTKKFITDVDLFQYKGINQLSKNWLVFSNNKNERNDKEIIFLCDITSSYYKDFYSYLNYLPLIRIDDLYGNDLIMFFQKIVKNPKDEDKLVGLLNKIFKDLTIKRLAIFEYFNGEEFLQISTNSKEDYHPITEYGDGFIKILRVIFELLYKENNFICIDEIDTGIHYSKMKDFWVNLMMVCKELNVQLFTTTHSKECIEAYVEASKELNEKDIRLIRLQENKDKSIKAICYKEEYIEYMVESNTEER